MVTEGTGLITKSFPARALERFLKGHKTEYQLMHIKVKEHTCKKFHRFCDTQTEEQVVAQNSNHSRAHCPKIQFLK